MRNFKVLTMVVIGLMVMGSAAVYAVEDGAVDDTQTSTVSLTIDNTCQLDITSPAVAASLSQDGNSETSYDAGYYTFAATPVLNVDANKKWKLTAKMDPWTKPDTYPSEGNKNTVDSNSDLLLYVVGGDLTNVTGFNATTLTSAPHTSASVNGLGLTSLDQTVANDGRGESDGVYTCTYPVLLDWANDIPGVYSTVVTYTLVTEAAVI